jgi:BMFP domain-containing protein YqiC
MNNSNFFSDLQGKINQALESGPAKDIERNVKAAMTSGFSKLDLVTREEFDIQAQVLAKTRSKLDALELRVIELEARLGATGASATSATAPAPGATPSATAPFPAAPEDPTIVLPPNLDKP